jgi:hypothetical protein
MLVKDIRLPGFQQALEAWDLRAIRAFQNRTYNRNSYFWYGVVA